MWLIPNHGTCQAMEHCTMTINQDVSTALAFINCAILLIYNFSISGTEPPCSLSDRLLHTLWYSLTVEVFCAFLGCDGVCRVPPCRHSDKCDKWVCSCSDSTVDDLFSRSLVPLQPSLYLLSYSSPIPPHSSFMFAHYFP